MAANQEEPCTSRVERGRSFLPAPALASFLLQAIRDSTQRVSLIGSFSCLVLFCLLFRDSLWHFYYAWTTDENYSHGFLVPLLGVYFANRILSRGTVAIQGGVLLGGLLLATALLGRLVTIPLPIPFVGDLALLIGLAGLFTLLLGSAALRRYWFVLFFLLFMVPLPVALYARIASPLQLLASHFASTIMNATGVPVLCEGNRMTLPGGVQMFVAEACSGMRLVTGFLALTTAVGYLTTRPGWYRAVVVLSALPIALTANVARVVLTGYIMHFINPQYASGAYHTLEGILMMGFGLILLNSLCSLLDQLSPQSTDIRAPDPHSVSLVPSLPPSRPPARRALLSGPGSWTSSGMTENLVPLIAPKEVP
jgi:exosortase